MYELIPITERTFYINCPAKIGLVKLNDSDVILIDSGNDKSAGRKVRQILDKNGFNLKAIYNTHSHADHIGGNKYLHDQTGCRIFAPGIEADFTNHPLLEPSYLYGGNPPKELRHKFLMAQPSVCEPLKEENLPDGFEIIPLPGHFFDMVGFKTPDDVIFLADCLSSPETIEKYKINVLYDVKAYLDSLETVKHLKASCFVPSHTDATQDIGELVQKNIESVHAIGEEIVRNLTDPISFDELLKRLFDTYALTLSLDQYVLVGSTVKSYLSWLMEMGRISYIIEENRLLWKAC